MAKYRCAAEGARLLLGSATPTVETFYHAQQGEYDLLELTERYNRRALPEVRIADLRQDIMSEETRKKQLHDAHRRIVESIFTKDVAAGSAAVEEHFALIDQRLETRTQNRAES